jgi:hypothetical protein
MTLIHFDGHAGERASENGFAYLKIYDLLKSFDMIDDFQVAIEEAWGNLTEAFYGTF